MNTEKGFQSSRKQTLKLALHHLWSRALLFISFLIVIAAIVLVVIRASTPLLEQYQQEIQTWLSQQLNYPVKFTHLSAGWYGFEPVIKIEGMTIENPKHQKLIYIDHFAIGLNILKTVIKRKFEIGLIRVKGTRLKIISENDGTTIIYGTTELPIATLKTNQQGNSTLVQNLFLINAIHLEDIKVIWQKTNNQTVLFHDVILHMINNRNEHHAWGLASIQYPKISKFSFVTNFRGDITKKDSLSGAIYIHGKNIELKQWLPPFQYRNTELSNGIFSGEIWGNFHKGKMVSIQSIISAHNITLENIKTSQKETISQLSGHIAWETNKVGWTLAGEHIQTTLNNKGHERFFINYQPAIADQKQNISAYLEFTSIANIKNFTDFLDYPQISTLISNYKLSGNLRKIYLNFTDPQSFAASVSYDDLMIHTPDKEDAIIGLTGKAYVFPTMGQIDFQNNKLQLQVKQIPQQTITLTNNFINKIYWYYDQTNLTIHMPQFQFVTHDIALQGNLNSLVIPIAKPAESQIDLQINTNRFFAADLKKYIPQPKIKHVHLFKFLHTAFNSGTATASLNLRGTMNQFPYFDHNGLFTAEVDFENIGLLYKPGWPPITNLNGSVNFNNEQLMIQAKNGNIFGIPFVNVTANIPDIADDDTPHIIIMGKIVTTLEHGMDFINHSPLNKTLGAHLKLLQFKGPANVNLNMNFSLKAGDHNDIVTGSLETQNAEIKLQSWGLSFDKVTGLLNFKNDVLTANNITGFFLQQPVIVNINTINPDIPKSTIQIKFASKLDTHQITGKIQNKIIDHISGVTNYTAKLQIFNHSTQANELSINSDLIGINLDLPPPFQKKSASQENLAVNIFIKDKLPINLFATLGKNISLQATFQKQKNNTSFLNGNLHFGTGSALKQTMPKLLINGSLPSFEWQQWKPILETKSNTTMTNILRLVDLNIGELNFNDYVFLKTRVKVTHSNQNWNLILNGSSILGSINLPSNTGKLVTMNLKRLYLKDPKQNSSKKAFTATDLPPLKVNIKSFHYNRTNYDAIYLMTQPMKTGLDIQQLTINGTSYRLEASGSWLITSKSQLSKLHGILSATDTKDFFSDFKYPNNIIANNLKLKFDLQWPSNIFKPSLKNMYGTANLQTGSGVFTDMGRDANSEIAMGQLLTIFSLQSLQHRFAFYCNNKSNDNGFSFDSINGDFQLNRGEAVTHNTMINGIIASINLDGNISIKNKSFNLFVQVNPKVTSSIPVIAAIAGGPVIGAATWLVNKLISPSVNQMVSKYFHLGGSWSKPKITPINSKPKASTSSSFI